MPKRDRRGNILSTEKQNSEKVSLRQYKEETVAKYGSGSLSKKMLDTMDKAVGSSDKAVATRGQLDNLNAKLKIGHLNQG